MNIQCEVQITDFPLYITTGCFKDSAKSCTLHLGPNLASEAI